MAKFNIERLRDVGRLVKELAIGIVDLNFADNFVSFEKELVISATSEARIRNELQSIPKKYIITSQMGNGLVTKSSTTSWDSDYLYLYNNGSNEVTITVVFIK